MSDRIGIVTGGGDCPGLNAVIRAVAKAAAKRGWETIGFLGGYEGILEPQQYMELDYQELGPLLTRGGTILGTANRGRFSAKVGHGETRRLPRELIDGVKAGMEKQRIRGLVSIGGDGSLSIAQQLFEGGVPIVGVPKTIDNDLPFTDSCPGYGSVVKHNATVVMEVGIDVGSMATDDGSCCIIEVMGRSAGWIAGGTVLAKRGNPAAAPHIVLLPEIRYDMEALLAKIKEVVEAYRYCVMVVGEGLKDQEGKEIGADVTRLDSFGHPVLAGAAEKLKEHVQGRLNTKTRTVILGYAQRAAGHSASLTDIDNAFACGEAAVRAAVDGQSGFMVKIVRSLREDGTMAWSTGLHPLAEVANVEHFVPRDWVSEDGFMPNEKFIEYVRPLVEGEVKVPMDGGLPKYVTLEKSPVERKLPPRA